MCLRVKRPSTVRRFAQSWQLSEVNGSQRAATVTLLQGNDGNGTAERVAYITVNDRRILYDTKARGSQRDNM